MLNHYSRPFRTPAGFLFFLFLICSIWIPTSCNKSSNQLKPFANTVKFSKTIDYNGSTLLLVDIEQKMFVGTDSLKLTISNPTGEIVDGWEVLIYVQKADEFGQTLDYRYKITLNQLSPQEDTTVVFNNYELPLEDSEIKIGLLQKSSGTNYLSGVYDGQIGYIHGTDSLPNTFSFGKGVIYADGKFEFWMELGSVNKKLSGQFIDTLSMNSIYKANEDLTSINCVLDTLSNGNKFQIINNTLQFHVKLEGQPSGSESKLWFNLYK